MASTVQLEAGSGMEAVRQQLIERGHHVEGIGSAALVSGAQRSLFGKAQAILRDPITGRVVGGSDPRGDGAVMAQV